MDHTDQCDQCIDCYAQFKVCECGETNQSPYFTLVIGLIHLKHHLGSETIVLPLLHVTLFSVTPISPYTNEIMNSYDTVKREMFVAITAIFGGFENITI